MFADKGRFADSRDLYTPQQGHEILSVVQPRVIQDLFIQLPQDTSYLRPG